MQVHRFEDEDLRILASLAIDLYTDHLYFKAIRTVNPKENYWSFDCRFTHNEEKFDSYYDSLYIDCGRDNKPDTYQMCVTVKKNESFKILPITSPLLVVHYFEEMCKKVSNTMN